MYSSGTSQDGADGRMSRTEEAKLKDIIWRG